MIGEISRISVVQSLQLSNQNNKFVYFIEIAAFMNNIMGKRDRHIGLGLN